MERMIELLRNMRKVGSSKSIYQIGVFSTIGLRDHASKILVMVLFSIAIEKVGIFDFRGLLKKISLNSILLLTKLHLGFIKYLSTVGTTGTHACGDTTIGVDSNESIRYVSLNQEAFDASASR
jgi:hypothetical protein